MYLKTKENEQMYLKLQGERDRFLKKRECPAQNNVTKINKKELKIIRKIAA